MSEFTTRLIASHLLKEAMGEAKNDAERGAVTLLHELLKREHESEMVPAEGVAEVIEKMSSGATHDGYLARTSHEWHFECAGFKWAIVREDDDHVDAIRQDYWSRWVVGFAKGDNGWRCEGTDGGDDRFVPSDVTDSVIAYVAKHGVPK